MEKGQVLRGIDEKIQSDLRPQQQMKRLLESGMLREADAEAIIERATYSEDSSRFTKWLTANYPALSEADVTYLSRLRFKDFGRLSARFLNQLEGANRETGEVFTILSALWNTNNNLMELLSDRFTFMETIQEEQRAYYDAHPQTLTQRLEEMHISNGVKRPVIRALEIVKEVTKAFQGPPEKIFIEMARGASPSQKGKRTQTRREQLEKLYASLKNEDVPLLQKQLEEMGADCDNRLQSDRLFLYFMQLGRCLYTWNAIDITQITGSRYNIEHIYPQSMVKDDSLLNNEILVCSEANGQKSDSYPVDVKIQNQCGHRWHMLHQNHLLSDEKLRRLTRTTPFSPDEQWGFINRQLTQTTQSTKAVATLLKEKYPNTEIVYVKARLTSEFRQEFDCIKSRAYNDLHHAKDAYLNIVTGNVYHMKFNKRWFKPEEHTYSLKAKTLFTHPVICGKEMVWLGTEDLARVKKVLQRNNAHLTRYAYCRQGGYFDQMPVKAAPGLIPRKAGQATEKYGGYNKPTVSFFIPVRYRRGKKHEITIVPVELLHADAFLKDDAYALTYVQRKLERLIGKGVDEITFPLEKRIWKVNMVLALDGYRVCVAGSSSGGKCLIASSLVSFADKPETERYLKRLESFCEKKTKNSNLKCDPTYDKITKEENLVLYELYIQKLTCSIYQKRINNPVETLIQGREAFTKLPVEEQAHVLLNIHMVFGRIASGCDLRLIGAAQHAAATVNFSSNISNWRKNYSDVRIVDESASGLWSSKSENLLELL